MGGNPLPPVGAQRSVLQDPECANDGRLAVAGSLPGDGHPCHRGHILWRIDRRPVFISDCRLCIPHSRDRGRFTHTARYRHPAPAPVPDALCPGYTNPHANRTGHSFADPLLSGHLYGLCHLDRAEEHLHRLSFLHTYSQPDPHSNLDTYTKQHAASHLYGFAHPYASYTATHLQPLAHAYPASNLDALRHAYPAPDEHTFIHAYSDVSIDAHSHSNPLNS